MSVTHFIFDILLLYERSSMKNSIFWARFTKLTPNITFIIILLSSLYCPSRDLEFRKKRQIIARLPLGGTL